MQVIKFVLIFILACYFAYQYFCFIKKNEISLTNIHKKYEYELLIKFVNGENQMIYLYSDSARHTVDSIKQLFYNRSKQAFIFRTRENEILIPFSKISYIELRNRLTTS